MYQDFKLDPTSATYKIHKEELQKKANRGAVWIIVAGGISLVFALINILFLMPGGLSSFGNDIVSLTIQLVISFIGLVYIALGVVAYKGKKWGYITALVLYILDSLLLLVSFNLIAIGIRLVVIYFIGAGLKNRIELDKMLALEKTAELEDHLIDTF